jgi:transitional endoplasmic reticulum ATPase
VSQTEAKMADEDNGGRRLQVANARPDDSGRGLARIRALR